MLILGASGQIAQWVIRGLAGHDEIRQTLRLRDPRKLSGTEPANARVMIGSVLEAIDGWRPEDKPRSPALTTGCCLTVDSWR